jgi:hypothetical protein
MTTDHLDTITLWRLRRCGVSDKGLQSQTSNQWRVPQMLPVKMLPLCDLVSLLYGSTGGHWVQFGKNTTFTVQEISWVCREILGFLRFLFGFKLMWLWWSQSLEMSQIWEIWMTVSQYSLTEGKINMHALLCSDLHFIWCCLSVHTTVLIQEKLNDRFWRGYGWLRCMARDGLGGITMIWFSTLGGRLVYVSWVKRCFQPPLLNQTGLRSGCGSSVEPDILLRFNKSNCVTCSRVGYVQRLTKKKIRWHGMIKEVCSYQMRFNVELVLIWCSVEILLDVLWKEATFENKL